MRWLEKDRCLNWTILKRNIACVRSAPRALRNLRQVIGEFFFFDD
jgi:hypothetical protein